jgi:hypothetical protein
MLMKGPKIPIIELNTVHLYQHYSQFLLYTINCSTLSRLPQAGSKSNRNADFLTSNTHPPPRVLVSWACPTEGEDRACLGTRRWCRRRRGMLLRQTWSGRVVLTFWFGCGTIPCVWWQDFGASVSRCGRQWRAGGPSPCIRCGIIFSFHFCVLWVQSLCSFSS